MILLVLLYVTAIVSGEKAPPYSLREGPQHFEDFIAAHNKVYSSDEEKAMRYEIFLRNLEEINQLNAKHEYAEFGVNQFTDLTPEEFRTRFTCYKSPSEYLGNCNSITSQARNQNEALEIPTQFDWRDKNVVARVKNQRSCASCWAFSAIANIESINAIKTGQLIELSEQQLVDCDDKDEGCAGGFPYRAIEYLMSKGAMSSASYPYDGVQKTCRYNEGEVAVKVKDCVEVNGTEDFIAEQLVAIGPLSIGIDSSTLHSYKGGVLHGDSCRHYIPNHAVLLIGYGVDNGMPYWLMKNSYGVNTEENGYFRMQRGVNCLGFATDHPVSAVI